MRWLAADTRLRDAEETPVDDADVDRQTDARAHVRSTEAVLREVPEVAVSRSRAPQAPCVIAEYCRTHGFIHGAEAEELRERFEKMLADGWISKREIRRILDDVDARDSTAFLEKVTAVASPPAPEGEKP